MAASLLSVMSGNAGNELGLLPLYSENLATAMNDIVKIATAIFER